MVSGPRASRWEGRCAVAYLVFHARRQRVKVRSRASLEADWRTSVYTYADARFPLVGIDASFEMPDLYRGWSSGESPRRVP